MINMVVLMGRLTADPELRTSNSGISYCRFTVAVDRSFTKSGEEKKTDFINCVAWRQTAEFVSRYFTKGQMIAVEGSIQTDSYTNKDGAKVYTTDILVSQVSFTGDKRGGETASESAPEDKPLKQTRAQRVNHTEVKPDMTDDDLPF